MTLNTKIVSLRMKEVGFVQIETTASPETRSHYSDPDQPVVGKSSFVRRQTSADTETATAAMTMTARRAKMEEFPTAVDSKNKAYVQDQGN